MDHPSWLLALTVLLDLRSPFCFAKTIPIRRHHRSAGALETKPERKRRWCAPPATASDVSSGQADATTKHPSGAPLPIGGSTRGGKLMIRPPGPHGTTTRVAMSAGRAVPSERRISDPALDSNFFSVFCFALPLVASVEPTSRGVWYW